MISDEEMLNYLRIRLAMSPKSLRSDGGYLYNSPIDMLLKEGRSFPFGSRPKWCGVGLPRHCFHNARELVRRFPDRVCYAEGYACGVIPVVHAWCVDLRTGVVIDTTWERGEAYYGIPVRTDYLTAHDAANRGVSLIDSWQEGFQFLKVPPEEWRQSLSIPT